MNSGHSRPLVGLRAPDTGELDLPDETPEEALQTAYQTLRDSVVSDLLDQVGRSSPAFFERLVVDVLVAMGYGGSRREAGEAIGHVGDEGIDGIIKEDRLGLDIIYIPGQAMGEHGRPPRGFRDLQALYRGDGLARASSSRHLSFSREARDYANNIDTKVILIAGARLAELMIDYGVGVTTDATYEVKRIDADYFADE